LEVQASRDASDYRQDAFQGKLLGEGQKDGTVVGKSGAQEDYLFAGRIAKDHEGPTSSGPSNTPRSGQPCRAWEDPSTTTSWFDSTEI